MMKPVLFGIVATAALSLATPSLAAAQVRPAAGAVVSSDKPADKQIEKAIKDDASLKHANIHVSVDDGVATLTGTVATDAQKARASRLAHVSGVTRVDNQLVVDPSVHAKGTTGTVAATGKKGAEKTKEGAEYVGEKTKEGAEKVANETSDAYILSRVKSRFVGVDVLKGSDIN